MNKRKGHPSNSRRFEIFSFDNFTCQYCGATPPEAKLEIDHIIPVSKGGAHTNENLITACSNCNFGKMTGSVVASELFIKRASKIAKIKKEREEEIRLAQEAELEERKRINATYKRHIRKEGAINFNIKLQQYLKEQDLKKSHLARKMGISPAMVHKYLYSGSLPDYVAANRLCKLSDGYFTIAEIAEESIAKNYKC